MTFSLPEPYANRGRGKIAALPKKLRHQVNEMIEEGCQFKQIKAALGEHGNDLTPGNLSEWKKHGFQAWRKEQFWREEMRARLDVFADFLTDKDADPAQLPMTGVQMSVTQLCELLRDIGPGVHKEQLATKDYQSALEYIQLAHSAAQFLDFTRAIVSHGEAYLKVHQLDLDGKPTSATEEIKIGYIKFDNGSRIIAFSSNPYAMAVYGGDVGLDEFAKHPNAKLLWQTAQGRVTWGFDLHIWSSHDGEDTLFNQFVQQARSLSSSSSSSSSSSISSPRSAGVPAGERPLNRKLNRSVEVGRGTPCAPPVDLPSHASRITHHDPSTTTPSLQHSTSPWNLYYRVTISDAIELGLLDIINRTQNKNFTPEQFLADCRARAGSDEIFQQSYMCNPLGASTASIVEWSAIERCRQDYDIERVHLESADILHRFGEFSSYLQSARQSKIESFLEESFPVLLSSSSSASSSSSDGYSLPTNRFRLGFDVAASGQGDLAVFYIDEACQSDLWLRGLLTARTEDWDFLKTVLYFFMENLRRVQAAGDETGLGRQICWEAAKKFPWRFHKVNFTAMKHDLGFALMNQLSVAEKHFPRAHQDIAADYFALRKVHTGTRWTFTEGRNTLNPVSHCDIAWAGALASHAHANNSHHVSAIVG